MTGTLVLPDESLIRYSIFIGGSPGPEVFSLNVFTPTELLRAEVKHPDPSHSVGYAELARTLLSRTSENLTTAPWNSAQSVVRNTVRTAQALRGIPHTGKSLRHV